MKAIYQVAVGEGMLECAMQGVGEAVVLVSGLVCEEVGRYDLLSIASGADLFLAPAQIAVAFDGLARRRRPCLSALSTEGASYEGNGSILIRT